MADADVVVIKLGSNALVDQQGRLDLGFLDTVAEGLAAVVRSGRQPVLVSSGAVANGMGLLGLSERPEHMPEQQALAALGQAGLVHRWQVALAGHGLQGAQILLTDADFSDRQRYLNLTATFRSCFAFGVIPVVNENDTVSVQELTVGDNDRLSALVAAQLGARELWLLTDIDGCYDRPPHEAGAQRIDDIERVGPDEIAMAGAPGVRGRGGMRSKLEAGALAAEAGVQTTIAKARAPKLMQRLLSGERCGTRIHARDGEQPSSRRLWLGLARRTQGSVFIDDGAVHALRSHSTSLLPAGVTHCEGDFARGDTVLVCSQTGETIARGLAGLSAQELAIAAGKRMSEAADALGYALPKTAIHRDNLLLV